MSGSFSAEFQDSIAGLKPGSDAYAPEVVDRIVALARQNSASDVHLIPIEGGRALRMLWRIDGVLHEVADLDHAAPNIVARLKVLAELLTYRTDVPQEGRIRSGDEEVEMRVSTFPTVHGEKAVVRLFVGSGRYRHVEELGLPADIDAEVRRVLTLTTGALLVTGPAGSGKTTTLYAALRHILRSSPHPRSICTLEDPIEALVPGVSQSHVKPESPFNYATGLRSLMRQDPEVIMVGEIRDRETAETVFQAALTGQLVLSSFHAGTTAEAVGRLLDLDVEAYLLRSGLLGVLSQRLVRRLCDCARTSTDPAERLGLAVGTWRAPAGCPACGQTGYRGRMLIAEYLNPRLDAIGRAILDRCDAAALQSIAADAGMVTLLDRARAAIEAGQTSAAEIRRVFGADSRSESPSDRPAIPQ
jgi:type II secretory ATPase GspE/PulE/Tfp pilus assembly ATPase PilB-like protein